MTLCVEISPQNLDCQAFSRLRRNRALNSVLKTWSYLTLLPILNHDTVFQFLNFAKLGERKIRGTSSTSTNVSRVYMSSRQLEVQDKMRFQN